MLKGNEIYTFSKTKKIKKMSIAHNVIAGAGVEGIKELRISEMVLFHLFFGNKEQDKLLEIIFLTSSGHRRILG